jgi:hypothetical protein
MHGVVLYPSRNAIIYKGISVSAIVITSGVNTLPNTLSFKIKTSLPPPFNSNNNSNYYTVLKGGNKANNLAKKQVAIPFN